MLESRCRDAWDTTSYPKRHEYGCWNREVGTSGIRHRIPSVTSTGFGIARSDVGIARSGPLGHDIVSRASRARGLKTRRRDFGDTTLYLGHHEVGCWNREIGFWNREVGIDIPVLGDSMRQVVRFGARCRGVFCDHCRSVLTEVSRLVRAHDPTPTFNATAEACPFFAARNAGAFVIAAPLRKYYRRNP